MLLTDLAMEKIKFFFVLLNPKRFFIYFSAVSFAIEKKLLTHKLKLKGRLSLPEGVLLYKLANSLDSDSVVLEIGCYAGLSSAFLLSGLKRKSYFYSIDPFDSNLKRQEKIIGEGKDRDYRKKEYEILENKPSKKLVENSLRKLGFSNFKLIEDYSFNVVKKWTEKIDLLWIDGDHDFNEVKKDFLLWSPFLKKGGFIVFHDANKKDKSSFWNMGWEGPTKVVKEFIKEQKWINIKRLDSIVYATKNFT